MPRYDKLPTGVCFLPLSCPRQRSCINPWAGKAGQEKKTECQGRFYSIVISVSGEEGQPRKLAVAAWQQQLVSAFADCDRESTRSCIEHALRSGLTLDRVLLQLIHPAMDTLGEMWGTGEMALTQVFLAACAIEEVVTNLAGQFKPPTPPGPKVVVGVLVDGHGLGARLVSIFLRASGVEVVEAGTGLAPSELVSRAREEEAAVLAVSVFLLRSANYVPEIAKTLRGEDQRIKLAVGGAPFRADPGLAGRVQADGWAPDAVRAAVTIRALANGQVK